MGCMYFCPKETDVDDPEILFAALYLGRLLTMKKISYQTALEIQEILKQGEKLENLMAEAEEKRMLPAIAITDYNGYFRSAFSASMIVRKDAPFRLGYIGFGMVFTNKRKLYFCAKESVYGLFYTLYRLHKQDRNFLNRLWRLASAMGNLQFGPEFHHKNYAETAKKIAAGPEGEKA